MRAVTSPLIEPYQATLLFRYFSGKIDHLDLDSLTGLARTLGEGMVRAAREAQTSGTDRREAILNALPSILNYDDPNDVRVLTAIVCGELSVLAGEEFANSKTVTLADVHEAASRIQWLWEKWLARGYLTVLAGEPGIGKTTLAMRLAGSMVTGMDWPDGIPAPEQPSNVVWVDTEGGITIAARAAKRQGIPQEHIIVVQPGDMFSNVRLDQAAHINAIRQQISVSRAKLVVVDSLGSGHRSDEKEAHRILPIVESLTKIASELDTCVVAIHHVTKEDPKNRTGAITIDRLRGSGVIGYLARTVIGLDHPIGWPEDIHRLHMLKTNLSERPSPLAFQVKDDAVYFDDPPDEASIVTSLTREPSRVEQAADWLRKRLSAGPVLARELEKKGEEAGFSKITLNRAKGQLGIRSRKLAEGWVWELPEAA